MRENPTIGFLLTYCAHLMRERIDARMQRYDVTPTQNHALAFLARCNGPVTQQALCEHLRVRPPTVNGLVDRLVEKGLVSRTVSGSDARCRLLAITDRGRELCAQCGTALCGAETMLFKDFSPEELEAFRLDLTRIIRNLEEDRTK